MDVEARPAVVVNNGKAFVEIAMFGTDAYERNILRDREFIEPIMVPTNLSPQEVLGSLNSGEKRLLKSEVDIEIDGVKVPHRRLSKR